MNRARALAILPGVLVSVLALGLQLSADPPTGVTFSSSPWTDEAWSVLGARNLVLVGTWAPDDLEMYLVQLPYHVALVGVFELFEVGIVQARALSLGLTAATVGLVALLAARHFGTVAGLVAGLGLATSPLVLYYGRLAYLEPMAAFFLAAGAAALLWLPGHRALLVGAGAGACLALAIGTKPSAVAAAIGILAGGGLGAWGRAVGVRPMLLAAVSVIGIGAAGWTLLIGLPQREAVEAALRFWPAQSLPDTVLDWVIRVGRYVRASDGANLLALPLFAGTPAGAWLAMRRWRTLDTGQRMLVGATVGWVALGMALIVLSAYRPNRYVVPLLPGFAMLTGVAAGLLLERLEARRALAAGALLIAVIAMPGAVLWGAWMLHGTARLPAIQADVARIVGSEGAVEGGLAPAFAMRAPVPTILSRPGLGINGGDLYATHGVRWVVADPTYEPAWVAANPEAWAGRELVRCYEWGPDGSECLIRVP